MNSARNLLKRLIKLYPVKVLKDEFNVTSVSDALYEEIIANNNATIIKDFVYGNINYTKQHIYIYELNANFNFKHFSAKKFPFDIITSNSAGRTLKIIISPIVDFKVILNNPFEEVTLKFHQPCIVTLKNKHLIFQFTILEKNLGSYFVDNRKVLDFEKENDEGEVIKQIVQYFAKYTPSICDINKGIKYLWINDSIDSKYAKWKKNRSTATEAMDEDYTLKNQYPDAYQSLLKSPLNKTIFKYLLGDELLPDHFTADPTSGELSIPLYSNNLNQVQNAINQILSNN